MRNRFEILCEQRKRRLQAMLSEIAWKEPKVISLEDADKILEIVGRFPRPVCEPDGRNVEDTFANGYSYALEAIRATLLVAAMGGESLEKQ